jgi:hypothetical protein
MATFKTVFEELVLTSSLPVGLQMLRTQRKLLDQNEGLGHPSPEYRARVLEELDQLEALLRKTHRSSEATPSPEPATAAEPEND